MSNSYPPCPAFQYADGYLVVRRVEKAYPVFLHCDAAYFPLEGAGVPAMLLAAELCASLDDFSAAAARLVSQPMLQPFEGGIPILLCVTRPGKEELFEEFADGLDQVEDYSLLKTLPPEGAPLVLVFGDPAVPLGERAPASRPASEPAPFDATETMVHSQLAAAVTEMPAEPARETATEVVGLAEPDLQPQPAEQAEAPAQPEAEPEPPEALVTATQSAMDDLMRPAAAGGDAPDQPEAEPTAGDAFDPYSEPALEVLLRQSPRLRARELAFGPPIQPPSETALGPSPDEVLNAVMQVVGALDEALRRQSSEQQAALQSVIVAVEQQSRALEVRQAEQWERQQQALRQMHTEQGAGIQAAIVRLDEERAAWQQQALRKLQETSAEQLPGALRQFQDELTARQQQSLQKLSDDLARRPAPAAPTGPLTSDAEMQNLNWQLEKSAVSSQDLRQRVGQLLWVNVILLVALVALAVGAFWLVRGGLAPAPAPTVTVAPTALPPTPIPPTPLPPTNPPSTATPAPTPTTAATALPLFVAALTCANTDRPRNFYDCIITNDARVPDTLALAVQPFGGELNGFNPIVVDEDERRIEPDAVTGLFSVGKLDPGEERSVRVMLPCQILAGCAETTFNITPLVDDGQTIVNDAVVEVTTHYFPPDVGTAP